MITVQVFAQDVTVCVTVTARALVTVLLFVRFEVSIITRWRGIYSTVFFVRSTICQQRAGRFTPNFACGRSLGRDVSSPLLGVSDSLGGGQKVGKWHGGGLIRA